MKKLLVLIFALLLAAPAAAAVTTSRSHNGWVVAFGNGDTEDSAHIDNVCATWRVSFDLGGGSAAATIYGLTNSNDATTAGTALTNGTLTAASLAAPVVVSTSLPYIKVDVVTGPSSGTARVWMYCTLTAGGGGDPNVVTTALGADVTTIDAAAGNAALPGLGFSVNESTNYSVECIVYSSSASPTIGANIQVTGPASPTIVRYTRLFCGAPGIPSGVVSSSSFFVGTDDNTTTNTLSPTQCPNILHLAFVTSAGNGGAVGFGLSAEIGSNSVTVHAGSFCDVRTVI